MGELTGPFITSTAHRGAKMHSGIAVGRVQKCCVKAPSLTLFGCKHLQFGDGEPCESSTGCVYKPHALFVWFWMCIIPSQLPFNLPAVPAKQMSVYTPEFLKHSQYLELQRMRLK